ncbi:hypothetical protein ACQKWADRAFT_315367 [Trichoderma austrokoningii]
MPPCPPSVSQTLVHYFSHDEMMRRAQYRQPRVQPAPVGYSFPLDPDAQALLHLDPHELANRANIPSHVMEDVLDKMDQEDVRESFLIEYNEQAEEHGMKPLSVDDIIPFAAHDNCHARACTPRPQSHGWLHRMYAAASDRIGPNRPEQFRLYKPDMYWPMSLSDMRRLTGLSELLLPPSFAAFPLQLPTCLRAIAQHIVENASTRGIFRVSGSEKVVEAFSRHYGCGSAQEEEIVDRAFLNDTLPVYIRHTAHDVASTFKRFLSRLPGGILGCRELFDVFVAIQEKLDWPPEISSAHQAEIRARLIAVAVATINCKYRRHLICAVFGLLNMIGRITELSPEERCDGQRLPPNHQRMDYRGLGICIGPLLIGEQPLGDSEPSTAGGPLPFSLSTMLSNRRNIADDANGAAAGLSKVEEYKTAARVAEMLITHWRDVVDGLYEMNKIARLKWAYLQDHPNFESSYMAHSHTHSLPPKAEDAGAPANGDGKPQLQTPMEESVELVQSFTNLDVVTESAPLESVFEAATLNGAPSTTARTEPTIPSKAHALKRSGAVRRRENQTPRSVGSLRSLRATQSMAALQAGSDGLQVAIELSAKNKPDAIAQSVSMDVIPPRGSSRHTSHFGASGSRGMDNNSSHSPLAPVNARVRSIEEPIIPNDTGRSPLSERLCEKGKAFKDSLAHLATHMLHCASKAVGPRHGSPLNDASTTRSLEREPLPTRLYRSPSNESLLGDGRPNNRILPLDNRTPFRLIDFAGIRPEVRAAMALEQQQDDNGPQQQQPRPSRSHIAEHFCG